MPEIKNKEIPELDDYKGSPDQRFWDTFPKRDLPDKAETKVNIVTLKRKVMAAKGKMSKTEFYRAKRTIRNLQEGASAFQKISLPPVNTVNAESTAIYRKYLTDTIATWVRKGFVAGPFKTPPMPGLGLTPWEWW